MPSPQIQFRAIPPLDTRLTERTGSAAATPAEVARRDLTRYYAFLADALARIILTEHEAQLISGVLNGTWIGEGTDTGLLAAHLHHEIADAQGDDLPEPWAQAVDGCVAKVASWTRFERLAVIDAIERWRVLPDRDTLPVREAFAAVGLRLVDEAA